MTSATPTNAIALAAFAGGAIGLSTDIGTEPLRSRVIHSAARFGGAR